MRLINAKNLAIEEFGPSNTPDYAILSHAWGCCEATFHEWRSRVTRFRKARRPEFDKVLATCKQARRDGLSHIWVDTVCIDKTSSAELSEAINSMFDWYEQAKICYVYLADIASPSRGVGFLDLMGRSRWFTRGWTLQELIAPDHVVFYSRSWTYIGTKKALASFISDVTGIDQLCIRKERALRTYSIAQRMSWAADRSTTRPEDMAYCLLGIFGINIPLLYGEGNKAFIRLQEEILRTSDDHSVLAFDTMLSQNSLLADHPKVFREMKHLQPTLDSRRITPPFSMTNAGLSMRTPLIRTLSPHWVLAVLNCVEIETQKGMQRNQICLPLLGKDGIYMRARTPVCLIRKSLSEVYIPGARTEISDLTTTVETKYLISHFTRVYPAFGYELDLAINGFDEDVMSKSGFMLTFPRGMCNYQLIEAYPQESLQRNTSFFNPPIAESGQPFAHGLLIFQDTSATAEPIRIGVYLAQTLDNSGPGWEGQWMCVLTQVAEDTNLYDRCRQSWQFENDPDDWAHYDHVGRYIAAARTRFTLQDPVRHAVMVEVVFDADDLVNEQGLDTGLVNFRNQVGFQETGNKLALAGSGVAQGG